MKMRYYLRGLGLGILITAVFFLVGGRSEQTMSDEMVKERAKELGMIENIVLADIQTVTTEEEITEELSVEETSTEEFTTEESTVETSTVETLPEESSEILEEVPEETGLEETTQETVEKTETQAPPQEDQVISIVVNKGEGSDSVSRHLYEAGLIEDAQAYDKYLMQNGYDRKIGAGEHLIPFGSDWETIAGLLCR